MDIDYLKSDIVSIKSVYDRGIINVGNPLRMKSIMNKAFSGNRITIGFIGGSITAGSSSSTHEKCYAYRVYSWWKEKFPDSGAIYINAGAGGTTSQFGAARAESDLLCHDPDVVFVEFSVNDRNEEFFQETYEALIRKILLHRTEPSVFLINNVFYDDGRNAEGLHNRIGLYYDLPIVSMRESIYVEVKKGAIKRESITSDNLHPNDLGHELAAGTIINLLLKIYDMTASEIAAGLFGNTIPEPLTKNRYAKAAVWNNLNSDPVLSGFFPDMTVREGVWDMFRGGWFGYETGNKIIFTVEGSFISIQYRKYADHPAPAAEAVIDNEKGKIHMLDGAFHETWGDCLYLQDVLIDGIPGKHTVEITMTKAVMERGFYIASVITA